MDTIPKSSENSSIYKIKPLHHLKLAEKQRKSQDCTNSDWFYLHSLEKTALGNKIKGLALKGGFMKREKVSSSVTGKKL